VEEVEFANTTKEKLNAKIVEELAFANITE